MKPKIRDVEKPISVVVTTILSYIDQTTQRNPFTVRPNVTGQSGISDRTGGRYAMPDLSDPQSLNQQGFTVDYCWGRTDEEYSREVREKTPLGTPDKLEIADLLTLPNSANTTYLNWNMWNWGKHPEGRPGFELLERLIEQ